MLNIIKLFNPIQAIHFFMFIREQDQEYFIMWIPPFSYFYQPIIKCKLIQRQSPVKLSRGTCCLHIVRTKIQSMENCK